MLSAIVAVTLSTPDPAAVAAAYVRHLHYRVAERGAVTRELADALGAPAAAGRDYVLLQPESGAPVYLRIVRSRPGAHTAPMKSLGWSANEILVQDPDALAQALADSPFRVIGAPAPIFPGSSVRAMQALGPADELLYFTRIPPEGGQFIATPARSRVDRTFIVVLAGSSMAALRSFYRGQLALAVPEAQPTVIGILNSAWSLPADHRTPLALARISPGFALELDEYPTAARRRPRSAGELPPGWAIVSFEARRPLANLRVKWRVRPAMRRLKPYDGRRAGILEGPAGEWIELIEAAADGNGAASAQDGSRQR